MPDLPLGYISMSNNIIGGIFGATRMYRQSMSQYFTKYGLATYLISSLQSDGIPL